MDTGWGVFTFLALAVGTPRVCAHFSMERKCERGKAFLHSLFLGLFLSFMFTLIAPAMLLLCIVIFLQVVVCIV